MGYKFDETKAETNTALASIDTLYQSKCVNWGGKTSDTKEPYSEVIANEILLNLKEFGKISKVTRSGSYCRDNHCKIQLDLCASNRDEENFAKRITGLKLAEIGEVIDYQVPLKNTSSDKGVGKIDLISYNEETKTFHLIELKYIGNKETLLRAILESYTYYQKVDQGKLIADYIKDYKFKKSKTIKDVNPNDYKIVPSVLLSADCNPYVELEEMEMGNRPKLKALSLFFGVNLYKIAVDVYQAVI